MAQTYRLALVNASTVIGAGLTLRRYLETTRARLSRMSTEAQQQLMDAGIRFLQFREAAKLRYTPKLHLMTHLLVDVVRFGNSLDTACWSDESMNQQFAAVSCAANTAVWTRRVLSTFSHEGGAWCCCCKVCSPQRPFSRS